MELLGSTLAGDVPKAAALMPPVSPTIASEIAHRGYAAAFAAALLTTAVVFAIQMRSARGGHHRRLRSPSKKRSAP